MTLQDLKTLIDYHYWARDRVLDAIEPLTPEQFTRDLGSSFKSVRDTVAHLHAAEWAWHQRWIGTSPTALLPADRFPDAASARQGWAATEKDVRSFVGSLDEAGVSKLHAYKLLNGADGVSPFWQMLQHVVNHASYHRGQLTTMLRQLGAQPPKPMDMIAFHRSQGVGARG